MKQKRKGYRYQLAKARKQEIQRNQWYKLLQEYRRLIKNPRS